MSIEHRRNQEKRSVRTLIVISRLKQDGQDYQDGQDEEARGGFVRCAIGQARDRPLPPVDGDRLIAIGQDQAILHYREMSGSGDPALQKRGRGHQQKKARREK